MTISRRRLALLAVLFFALAAAVRADPPAVSMSFPTPNATVSTQLTPTIFLQANVSDLDDGLWGVAFFICVASGSGCASTPTELGVVNSSPYEFAWVPPPPTIYQQSAPTSTPYLVWAIAVNSPGQETTSATVPFTLLQPASQPSVKLIVPDAAIQGLVLEFVTPAAPVFYATALPDNTIPPSTIVRVEFLDGADVIGTVATPNTLPSGYAFTWSNAPPGAHLISARAVDSYGDWTVSPAVPVYIVGPDVPPTVTMTAPTSGQIFTRNSSVPLAATASSGPGYIERVDFTAGATVIASVFSPPFTSNWVNPPPGHFTITATAYDDLGIATTSPAAYVQVLPAPRLPSVVLTAPTPGTAIAAGTALPLAATALAPDGSISRVDFLAGNSVIGSSASVPYTYTWTNPTVGVLALTAKAYDLQGISGTSTAVPVSVINGTPPAVALTAPAGGAAFAAPGSVSMSATATPATGATIAKVEFLANGSVVGTRNAAPFSFTWGGVAIGNYSLAARATDNLGSAATSNSINVSVLNDVPPSVTLTAPSSGQTFYIGQPIAFSANASDSDGTVTKVEFLVDGAVITSAGSAPYAYTWTSATVGTHGIAARATDNLNVATTSPTATITVAANNPPTVNLTAPANGQAFAFGQAITLTASASDSDGTIAKVEFLADGVVVGTSTTSPYTMSWTGAALGTHALAARATDNRGAPVTSTPVNITVNATSAPTVSLAMPRANKVFAAGATVNLAAAAADAGGTIVRVEFYAGATLIGTVTTAPYNFAWTNVVAGNYVLTAKAIDNQTATATSTGVPIQVTTPALTITTPAANVSIAADFTLVMGTYQGPPNSGVTVNGEVANNDGQGHYFINNVPLAAGANTLTVILTTSDGQTVTLTQTVTNTAPAPMLVYAKPDADFAPASFTIKLLNRSANSVVNINYANLGGGQLNGSNVDQTTLGTITYATPGIYTPQFILTDSRGNTYTQTLAILVQDKAVLDGMLRAVFNDMTTALRAGDQATAVAAFIGSAQAKYGAVFAALAPWMPTILNSWSPLGQSSLSLDVAEYAIKRVINGKTKIYFVYFIRDVDGTWRLDSM